MWSGCGVRGGCLADGAVVIDIDGAPGAGDAAGVVAFGALGSIELDGVEDADGEGVGFRKEGGGLGMEGGTSAHLPMGSKREELRAAFSPRIDFVARSATLLSGEADWSSGLVGFRRPLVHPADLWLAVFGEADGEPDVAGVSEVVLDPAVC